jgi:hypothetical protein
MNTPRPSLAALRVSLVASLISVTVAPGTTWVLLSTMVPDTGAGVLRRRRDGGEYEGQGWRRRAARVQRPIPK